jgi:hypothetical protein
MTMIAGLTLLMCLFFLAGAGEVKTHELRFNLLNFPGIFWII